MLEKLGTGATGVVWAAHDPELDRRVAVKLLHSPRNEARLLREARALARLAHPNVVAVFDVGSFAGRPFVAMELVAGITLRRWLEERPRPFREVLDLLVSAGSGLAAAHAAGLVHRDVKPDNVLLGDDGRARVLDFGLVSGEPDAEATDDAILDATPGRLTETGALMGTPAYMAPEQFRAEEVDARTDQFSYCVMLWEAVCGERPFRGATVRELSRAVVGGVLAAPPRDRSVPAWLRRALTRGLSVDRDARFPSMEALLAAITAGLAGDAAASRLVGRRYERIEKGDRAPSGSGERALDRLGGAVVTLMRVGATRAEGDEGHAARLALARRFRRLASLRHPNLVAVLDLSFDPGGFPYFILDHHAAPSPDGSERGHVAQPPIERLVQLLRALSYLHRHGVTHGAITPEAVRVSAGQLKLLPPIDDVTTANAFVAPEVARGGPPSPAADLFAFGVLAYQTLARRLPFGGVPRGETAPDLSAVEGDPEVAPVIGRLLEADPAARYASAEEVIAALAAATGRTIPADTAETRESFLRTAPLVGRAGELDRLDAALREAQEGRGSAWLVGGESGVGKSRLIEELRTLALVRGALVLRGQESREGGSAYRVFQGALRWLALLSDPDELEAGVLLPIVPDLAKLLGHPVTPAPELDAPSMHSRVVEVVARLLTRQEQPIALLLEDLHWSRSDSLKLLQSLTALTKSAPLLIVATYRDDERPGLRDELGGIREVALSRLDPPAIADLSAAMLGEPGRRPELLALLARETEGNAFFVVEVVRALAEEAGGLDRIAMDALPDRVFVGGIRAVVQRRLKRVPAGARGLLQTAAVIGRTIDPALLGALAPGLDLESWTGRCVEAVVLERTGEDHRFAHDKLREGLLAEIHDDERKRLHGAVADALEQLYGGAPERCAALAHHFREAGRPEEEARYSALAGEQAVRDGAILEGKKLLERALSLHATESASPLERAHCLRILGEAEYFGGSLAEANRHLSESLRVLGYPPPRGTLGLVMLILSQLLVQIGLRLTAKRRAPPQPDPHRIEASKAAGRMSNIGAFMVEGPRVLGLSLLGVNLAERGGGADVCAMAMLGYAAGALGLVGAAQSYFDRGRAFAIAGNRPGDVFFALHVEASFQAGHAIERSVPLFREAVGIAVRIGEVVYTGMADGALGEVESLRGRFEARVELWQTALSRLDASHADQRATLLPYMADAFMLLGRFDEAERALASAEGTISDDNRLARTGILAARARLHAYRGEIDQGLAAAEACVRTFKSGTGVSPLSYYILEGVAEAAFASWQRALDARSPEAPAIARFARRVLREVEAWGRMYPTGRPLTRLIRGRHHALAGAGSKARAALLDAVRAAQELGTPFFEAQACFELGRACPIGGAERRERFATARRLFTASKAAHHLKLLEAAESTER